MIKLKNILNEGNVDNLISSFNDKNPNVGLKVTDPGTRVWTDSWGRKHREPGSIKSTKNDDSVQKFWDFIKVHPQMKSLGKMKVTAIENPVEVFKMGTYYFAPIYKMNKSMWYIEFGNINRLKNSSHFRQ